MVGGTTYIFAESDRIGATAATFADASLAGGQRLSFTTRQPSTTRLSPSRARPSPSTVRGHSPTASARGLGREPGSRSQQLSGKDLRSQLRIDHDDTAGHDHNSTSHNDHRSASDDHRSASDDHRSAHDDHGLRPRRPRIHRPRSPTTTDPPTATTAPPTATTDPPPTDPPTNYQQDYAAIVTQMKARLAQMDSWLAATRPGWGAESPRAK